MDYLAPPADPRACTEALARWLEAEDPARLLIETSGSTGRPKRVLLSRDAMLASARATASRLGGEGRWALRLPSSYVAGVQVVLRSLLAGHPPLLSGGPAGESTDSTDSGEPAAYTSLVPTQLHRALDQPAEVAALRDLRAVLLGGGPIDPGLRERAEQLGIRVVATYGASETAGGCVYDGVPLDGVRVEVELLASEGVPLSDTGRIRLAGPTLFDGYLGDPELTARTLVAGWYRTPDVGRLDADGRLQVLGRIDDVVLSGGVNVPLPAVARRLREHPGIAQAEVLGVPDPEWGQRVVAFLVGTRGEPRASVPELRDWVAEVHPRAWAPWEAVWLDALPLLGTGKTDRQRLLARHAEGER